MSRNPLPTRRPCVTQSIEWQGHDIAVTVGLYPDTGKPGEVFAHVAGQLMSTANDGCILASRLLQRGDDPAEMAKAMTRELMPDGSEATASPIGAILATLGGGE